MKSYYLFGSLQIKIMVICTTDLESCRYCIVWQTKEEFFLLQTKKERTIITLFTLEILVLSLNVSTVVTRVATFLNFCSNKV